MSVATKQGEPAEASPSVDPYRVVDRGPNWLIIRVTSEALAEAPSAPLADRLWGIASRHFTYRLVLELDDLGALGTGIVEELVLLRRRLMEHGGALRLCGLRPECSKALLRSVRSDSLANHPDRHAAVGDSWCGGPSNPPRPVDRKAPLPASVPSPREADDHPKGRIPKAASKPR